MGNKINYGIISHFSPKEFQDDMNNPQMDRKFVITLDYFRNWLNIPININYGLGGKHKTDSYHYQGLAVDCYVKEISLFEFFIQAIKFGGFKGIGLYPFWYKPGLHLDSRPSSMINMWGRNSKGKYVSVTNISFMQAVLRR